MKKNLLIALSVLTLVCGVCSVGAATPSDTTASGSAVTVENKHKDGERQKGDMAKVTSVTSDTITVTNAEKPERPDNATDVLTDLNLQLRLTEILLLLLKSLVLTMTVLTDLNLLLSLRVTLLLLKSIVAKRAKSLK